MTAIEVVQAYLATQPKVATGDIVHAGWLVFRVAIPGDPVELESLDFNHVATFTKDLREAEAIFGMQADVLRLRSLEEEPCTLRHAALVSKSYRPGHPQAFLQRDRAAADRDSGWYVGVLDDPIDLDDPASFCFESLYELSCRDRRMLRYWLLPVGAFISLSTDTVDIS